MEIFKQQQKKIKNVMCDKKNKFKKMKKRMISQQQKIFIEKIYFFV